MPGEIRLWSNFVYVQYVQYIHYYKTLFIVQCKQPETLVFPDKRSVLHNTLQILCRKNSKSKNSNYHKKFHKNSVFRNAQNRRGELYRSATMFHAISVYSFQGNSKSAKLQFRSCKSTDLLFSHCLNSTKSFEFAYEYVSTQLNEI